jgi:hypothetical protein
LDWTIQIDAGMVCVGVKTLVEPVVELDTDAVGMAETADTAGRRQP